MSTPEDVANLVLFLASEESRQITGTYIVIDHMAQPGSGMRDTTKFHRIDPAMPWGGFKESSIGREVGLQAYRAYTQTQTVVVKLTTEPFDWYGGSARYS